MEATDRAGRREQILRLEREEQDLRDRLEKRAFALHRAGREPRSDPLYQSLDSVLAKVRRLLAHARGDDSREANVFLERGERRLI